MRSTPCTAGGIAHRDVKPSNILITRTSPGHPLLTDFGLAAPFGEVSRPREGTLAYLAPERWAGGGAAASADVYALAAVLFELLTGEQAFERTRESHHEARRPTTLTRAAAEVLGVEVLDDDEEPAVRRRSPVSDGLASTLTERPSG